MMIIPTISASLLFFIAIHITACICQIQPNQQQPQIEPLHLRRYEENCSDSNICDVKESLVCRNGTCDCADPLSMIFDPTRGICVGKSGHPCVLHLSETSVPPPKRIGPCVIHATCENDEGNKNNTCRCWSSFYTEASTGFCLRRREYLQKCDSDEQCNSRKGFICNKEVGICSCDTTVNRYNEDTERCVGLPNQECANIYRECTENHKCKTGVCRCKFKEVESANGTLICDPVRHKYNKPCGRFRGDCGDESVNNLRCLDGKCRCKNPDYQMYDHDRRICLSKVGGPCTLDESLSSSSSSILFRNGSHNSKFDANAFPIIQCISYAHCVPFSSVKNSSRGRGVCECGTTFIETKKGLCSLPFGADCDTSSKNKKDQCASSLQCVSGRCACPNEVDIYEPESRKCSKSVKSLCWKDASCVKNAICKQRNKALPGRCKCSTKFKATSLATCV